MKQNTEKMQDGKLPNDQAQLRCQSASETKQKNGSKNRKRKNNGGAALDEASCSTSTLFQKTKSFDSQVQMTLENVIEEWRPRFPKLSDLLAHVDKYPKTLVFAERMLCRRLKPLLDQWLQEGRPDVEWPEPSEYA